MAEADTDPVLISDNLAYTRLQVCGLASKQLIDPII